MLPKLYHFLRILIAYYSLWPLFWYIAILRIMLGEELRKARLKAGLSQESLADQAGLHRTYISLLERNKKSPTLETLFSICKALNVSAAGLIKKVESGLK